MKVVITGGRDYQDEIRVWDILDALKPSYVYVGDCPTGVDHFVTRWCDETKTSHKIFTANWDKFGKRAGPLRNGAMLDDAGPQTVVIAFEGGRGTEDCVRQAKLKDMLVMRVEA